MKFCFPLKQIQSGIGLYCNWGCFVSLFQGSGCNLLFCSAYVKCTFCVKKKLITMYNTSKNVILVSAVLDVVNVFFSYDNRGRLSWCLNSLTKDGHAWCHKLIASVCCV